MLKRGMQLDFVHFHSVPRTNPASIDKVHRMVEVLNRYQHTANLASVPLLSIQEQIVAKCPEELRVLLYRRFMVRLADACAGTFRSSALLTAEALAQVASQTIENLAAVESVAQVPVLRPLIGSDKQEIIALARRIGSYEISIEAHQDCCSFLMPSNPATKSHPGELAAAEESLEVDELVSDALDRAEFTVEDQAASWDDVVLPDNARS
jgi:thiamine biosynthesis protein ThiI